MGDIEADDEHSQEKDWDDDGWGAAEDHSVNEELMKRLRCKSCFTWCILYNEVMCNVDFKV